MYSCIIFDIDGTMTDSENAVRVTLAELMKEEFGGEFDPAELKFTFGVPGVNSLRKLGFREPEKADKKWAALMQEKTREILLFSGIRKLVKTLKEKGFRLGIVTSKTRYEYETEFEKPYGDFSQVFETYICADDTECHKPDPQPMLECLRRMGCSPREALYVGDTVSDFRCAEGAGVDFALACWGAGSRDGIGAKFYPASPVELLAMLNASLSE